MAPSHTICHLPIYCKILLLTTDSPLYLSHPQKNPPIPPLMVEHHLLPPPPPSVDPTTGFCRTTKTFHSLRPPLPLPLLSLPLSFPSFAFSLLPSPLPSHPALVSTSSSSPSLSFSDFVSQFTNLSSSLSPLLSKGQVAFILSPSLLDIPLLYFSLLSLGVVVSPSNPLSTPSEISRQLRLVNPSIIFTTFSSSSKLPPTPQTPIIHLDSAHFTSLKNTHNTCAPPPPVIHQTDPAVIQFSSGTTGLTKAALLSHRNFIAMTATWAAARKTRQLERMLVGAPMFHSMGFIVAIQGVAMGNTTVVMERVGGLREVVEAAARFRVTAMTAATPVVVAMGREEGAVERYDLEALEKVVCGGAPLSVEAAHKFMARYPRVELLQGYGSTEGGGISQMINRDESLRVRSVGRLSENVQAKIVDVATRKALAVGHKGELYLRSPAIMIGYVGDEEANAAAFDSEGWLKTGDLCYFDNEGFLYIVDRLKELIKYKGYQVPPAELESALHSLPDVVDAAVVPYPNEQVGQIPVAFVVRKSGGNLSEQQIMDHVAKQVAPYKKIRKVVFTNSIPKSASGKILRRELASHALANISPRL